MNRGLTRATLTTALADAIRRTLVPAPLAGTGDGAPLAGTADDAEPVETSALAPLVTVAALTPARSLKVARNVLR